MIYRPHTERTEIALHEKAKFCVVVDGANPTLKDRINSLNAMFCYTDDERRHLVNTAKYPVYIESL